MSLWTVVTPKVGLAALADVWGKRLDITRAVFSSAVVPVERLEEQTAVSGKTCPAIITDKSSQGETTLLKIYGANKGLTSEFPVSQIWVFATVDGGAEIPIRLAQRSKPDLIPAEADSPEAKRRYNISVLCGNASSVVVHVDAAAVVTVADLEVIRAALDKKNGSVLIGPAAMVSDLEPGGMLFITDDESAANYFTSLDDVLTQGYNLAVGKPNTLSTILTVGVARALNIRRDDTGVLYVDANISQLVAKVGDLCRAAVEAGRYVDTEAGRVIMTRNQVQEYIFSGKIITSAEADTKKWPWVVTPATEHAEIKQELGRLWAMLGDYNQAVDEVNEGVGVDGEDI